MASQCCTDSCPQGKCQLLVTAVLDLHPLKKDPDTAYEVGYADDAGSDLVYRCVSPMNKAVPWMRVVAVFIMVFSLLGLAGLFLGNWPALIMLIPLWISVLLMGSARKVRTGMLKRNPRLLRQGLDNLTPAIRVWAIVLIVYLLAVIVIVFLAMRGVLI